MNCIDALIIKLQTHVVLEDDDISSLKALPVREKTVAAKDYVVRTGDKPDFCTLLIDGVLMRSKVGINRRQILSLHIAGEIPDLQSLFLHVLDHDLIAVTPCRIGVIGHATLKSLIRQRPSVAEALWRETLIEASIFREWILNLGARPAEQRAVHLLLEMKQRLIAIGHGKDDEFELPLTQEQFGDALGTTPIHVNRVLKHLRQTGLVTFRRRTVKIHDLEQLERLGDFDRLYLHQDPRNGP